MAWLGLLLVGLGLICFIISWVYTKGDAWGEQQTQSRRSRRRFFGFSGLGNIVVGFGFFIAACIAVIPPGHVGVQVLFGSVQQYTLPEGLSVVNPFVSVYHMSGRTQTYTMRGEDQDGAIVALSGDGLRIPMDISVIYRLDPSNASWVLQNVGFDYQNILLQPAARTAVRESAARFSAQDAYSTKRDELSKNMAERLNTSLRNILKKRGFKEDAIHIEQVLLRNVDLPARVKDAIEQKLEADQQSQRMVYILRKERQEAERKEIEAGGIQKFQEIVSKGIDERLLKWKGIEATERLASSTNSKVIVIGGADGLPLILNTDTSRTIQVQNEAK